MIEFVDIAGLVKGASKGEGLGNQFLSNIREVDAIVHVVRCFEDPQRCPCRRKRESAARHRDDQPRADLLRPGNSGTQNRQSGQRAREWTRSLGKGAGDCWSVSRSVWRTASWQSSFETEDEDEQDYFKEPEPADCKTGDLCGECRGRGSGKRRRRQRRRTGRSENMQKKPAVRYSRSAHRSRKKFPSWTMKNARCFWMTLD